MKMRLTGGLARLRAAARRRPSARRRMEGEEMLGGGQEAGGVSSCPPEMPPLPSGFYPALRNADGQLPETRGPDVCGSRAQIKGRSEVVGCS